VDNGEQLLIEKGAITASMYIS